MFGAAQIVLFAIGIIVVLRIKGSAMKAVQIHQYGDAHTLHYEDVEKPTVRSDDVLIRVVGTSVNPIDWKIRQGHLKEMIPYDMPIILGWDVSGVVVEVGEKVSKFKVGDNVYSRPDVARDGTYAEFISVREAEVAMKPNTISHIEAAVLPLVSITAWEVLVNTAQVSVGQRVLIHAASGGVGAIAVQLAKAHGAYVIGTASAANRDLVESLGVDEFVDYHKQTLHETVKQVDIVFDTMGGQTQKESWSVLAPDGILVSIVSPPDVDVAKKLGFRSAFVMIKPDALVLEGLAKLVDSGKVRPIVGAEFSLNDMKAAHRLSESGRARGKIAVYVGQP
jgi:NADPH:quinone reductase-like Zn-dependent oxidoreductase